MLRVPRLVVVLVALAVASLGVAHAATSPQNDAGSGADAGNALEDSLRIPGFGGYGAGLAGGDASDWYKWKLGSSIQEPTCVDARVATSTVVGARLVSVDRDVAREMKATVLLTRATWMGLASPGFTGGFLRVDADTLSAGTTLPYDFALHSLRASQLPAGDGGSGSDAPATRWGAFSAPGACFGGRLDRQAGDAGDVYAFGAQFGDRVTISLADPAGAARGSITDGGGYVLATLGSGQAATFNVPATGTYYLSVATSTDGAFPYLVGLCEPDCGPPQSPCQPMCIAMIDQM